MDLGAEAKAQDSSGHALSEGGQAELWNNDFEPC